MKEFNLSEKRKDLKKILEIRSPLITWDSCFELIEKQDKEFIKKLKRKHYDKEFNAIIISPEELDKLAGDKLI